MKKNILLLLSVLVLSGCGRELKLAVPAKSPVKLNENLEALSVSPTDFSSFSTTFSMFFIPTEDELTWESNLYQSSDTFQTKVARIMNNIIRKSNEFDLYDQKIIDLNKEKEPLTREYEELDCDFDYTDECMEIDKKREEISKKAFVILKLADGTEKQVNYEGYKSFLIEDIQASVDDYNREKPELNRPKNWMLYGDAPLYEIRQLEDGSFKITFPNLGPFGAQNYYSTESGEIVDVKLAPSEFNAKIELLTFKVKEKDEHGKFTSMVWEFTLERSFKVGKLRYKGDVLKADQQGNIVRRGICKIDFAPKGT